MIRQIQYLRGIAALMVVWFHATTQIEGTTQFVGTAQWGSFGVDLFFAISGFIMLVTTWDKPIGPAEFIQNRLQRIVPLYWLATSLMVIAAIAAPAAFKSLQWDWEAVIKSLLFVPYYSLSFPNEVWPVLVPGWSLNYEMFFYALFALALLVARNWRVPVMVAALALLVVGGLIGHPRGALLVTYTNPRLLEFAVGMILGRLWVMKKHPRQDGGHPVLMALGDASYSIYLTHLFTLGVLRVLWSHFVHTPTLGSSIAWMAMATVGCAMAGWICFLGVERPITRGFKRWHPLARAKETYRRRALGR